MAFRLQRLKEPARVATTTNVATLAGGAPSTVDGVSLVALDRVLVKDQTTDSENGVYQVDTVGTGANGSWSRTLDTDGNSEVRTGDLLWVQEGNQSATWQLLTPGTITVGVTSQAWGPVAGSFPVAAGTLFVNHSTGNDSNTGTSGSPLATFQEAIKRLYPTDGSIPDWAGGADRIIEEQFTGKFQESIHIPPRTGEGALIFRGQQTTVQAITQSGALTAVSGRVVRRLLTATAAVSGPVADNCIAFPPSAASGFGNPFEDSFDYCPVVAVGATDVTIDSEVGGSSFFYGNAVSIDLNRPDSTWQPGAGAAGFFGDKAIITNEGAPLIVERFRFQTADDSSFDKDIVLCNKGAVNPAALSGYGSRVYVRNSILEPNPDNSNRRLSSEGMGSGMAFAGCIIEKANFSQKTGLDSCLYMNCRFPDSAFYSSASGIVMAGVDIAGTLNINFGSSFIDFRGDLVTMTMSNASSMEVTTVSFNNPGGNGLNLFSGSSFDMGLASSIVGTVSARALNLQGPMAICTRGVTAPTLTGTIGDLFVGDEGPFDFTQDRSDPRKGCFFETGNTTPSIVTSLAADTTLDNTHNIVLVNAAGGPITITLPLAASHPNRIYKVKKTDSSTSAVTITRSGANTIDGSASTVLLTQYAAITLASDESNWYVF